MIKRKPHYPLEVIKDLLKKGHFSVEGKAPEDALYYFGWELKDIVACLMKLNDRHYTPHNPENHYYKTETNRAYPNTKMDYYKAYNIMEGNNIYTNFYIHPESGKLIVNSFKEIHT